MNNNIISFLVGVMLTSLLFLSSFVFSGCVTTTEVCLECPYGTLEYNRTMDTSK